MSVSLEARSRYRHAWRRLVTETIDLASREAAAEPRFGSYALGARDWITPTEDRGETAVCGALGPMAYAYAKADTIKRRAELAPALKGWAEAVLAILDRADPPASASQRSLPFRADLDG